VTELCGSKKKGKEEEEKKEKILRIFMIDYLPISTTGPRVAHLGMISSSRALKANHVRRSKIGMEFRRFNEILG